MKITRDNPSSSFGVPVILGDDGCVMDYGPGLYSLRRSMGLSRQEMADRLGVVKRTVESWEQGRRMIPTEQLYKIMAWM